MWFVIAGVQPKTKQLEQTPRRCPRCGLPQAYAQRVDHYLSLFFIPLLRVKSGEPFLYCLNCRQPVDGHSQPVGDGQAPPAGAPAPQCRQCGRTLQASFKYCPHCGQRQK